MDELEKVLTTFINQAKEAMRCDDYDRAIDRMRNALKCAVLGAEKASPANKAKYVNFAKSFKETIEQLEAKRDAMAKSKAPTPPAAPAAPSEPKSPSYDAPAPKKDAGKEGGDKSGPTRAPDRNDALRPLYLSDYIGQPGAVMAVRDLITAARLKDDAMPHLIVYGSHGLGKTTFAKIIANEMRANFIEVNASKITPAEMIAILKKIQRKDIMFIDEIHTVPLVVAESILYSAMQDGRITYTEGKGATARTNTIELPRFTLIGATTEIGKLAKPFTQRAVQVRLEEYTDEVLASIITSSFYKLGLKINPENSLYISKRCRNNPRIANSHVKRISDKALVRYAQINNLTSAGAFSTPESIRALGIEVSDKVIEEFFKENGIDEWGLEKGDRVLLELIIHRYHGGPVGLDTLARAMNEANNVIAQKYEAYLIKKGMLRVDREGRVAMAAAYVALGIPVPEEKKDPNEANGNNGANGGDGNNGNTPSIDDYNKSINPKYDKKTMIVSHVPEELKVKKIEDLIVYPDNVITVTENLDDLFPDVEKPYEAETKHLCELELDFDTHKRTLICDSFLESRFARAMASVGFLHDIKAQTLEIAYVSQELANRRYFPDFVVKDYKDRLAIIEMKNFDMVSYHLNIDKYEHLRRYCESKGYGYSEIMKAYDADTYISVDMLERAPVNQELKDYIRAKIEENGQTGEAMFTEDDFTAYCEQNGKVDRAEVYTILLTDRSLKNVDRVGNSFKIINN